MIILEQHMQDHYEVLYHLQTAYFQHEYDTERIYKT